jgi:hypothetical protein
VNEGMPGEVEEQLTGDPRVDIAVMRNELKFVKRRLIDDKQHIDKLEKHVGELEKKLSWGKGAAWAIAGVGALLVTGWQLIKPGN